MPAERAAITAFYRLALEFGLLSKAAPIAWADRRILAAPSGEADPRDIELSLAVNRPIDDVMSILHSPCAQGIPPTSFRMLAALLHRKLQRGELEPARVARLLYKLHATDPSADDTLGTELCWIDEAFEGEVMDPADAPQFVRDFLKRFEAVELPE
jgi:hypothetical protein